MSNELIRAAAESQNTEVQGLLLLVRTLDARVQALEAQFASLPEQFVIPGPNGETPKGLTSVSKTFDAAEETLQPNSN